MASALDIPLETFNRKLPNHPATGGDRAKGKRSIIAFATVFLLAFSCVLAPSVSATAPPAQPPVWQKGDSWAMGGDFDWGSQLSGPIRNLTEEMGMDPDVSLDQFDIIANGSAWIVFKVTDANPTEYNLNGKLAAKLEAAVHMKATMSLPDPGTYDNAIELLTAMHDRTIQLDLVVELGLVIDTNTVFQNGTMAIKSSDIDVAGSALASLDLVNIPSIETNDSTDVTTVSYTEYHVDLSFSADVQLHVAFDPWLELIQFPLSVGDAWNVDSQVTISGGMTGSLDISGLPAEIEQEIFSNEALSALGITSFPVDFSDISTESEPRITNGVLEPVTTNISASMECVSATYLDLPLYGNLTVYKISVNDGQAYLYYSDDIKFLAQTDASLSGIGGLPSGIPDLGADMQPVQPATAEQNIASISSYESTLLTGGSGGSSGGIDPIIAILVGVVLVFAAAVVIAVLLVRRKK